MYFERSTCLEVEVVDTRCDICRVVRSVVLRIVRDAVSTNSNAARLVGHLGDTGTLFVEALERIRKRPVATCIRSLFAIEVIEVDHLSLGLFAGLLDGYRLLVEDCRYGNCSRTFGSRVAGYRDIDGSVAFAAFGRYDNPLVIARNRCPVTVAPDGETLCRLSRPEGQRQGGYGFSASLLGDLQRRDNRIDLFGVTSCKQCREESYRQQQKHLGQILSHHKQ